VESLITGNASCRQLLIRRSDVVSTYSFDVVFLCGVFLLYILPVVRFVVIDGRIACSC